MIPTPFVIRMHCGAHTLIASMHCKATASHEVIVIIAPLPIRNLGRATFKRRDATTDTACSSSSVPRPCFSFFVSPTGRCGFAVVHLPCPWGTRPYFRLPLRGPSVGTPFVLQPPCRVTPVFRRRCCERPQSGILYAGGSHDAVKFLPTAWQPARSSPLRRLDSA